MKKPIKNNFNTIVYTTGVFDLLHPGHLNLLRRAKALGDKLIVGVQDDESVEKQKGRRPIMSCEERISMLQALPFVDVVMPYSDLDQRKMLKLIKPNIMVQGGDWQKRADRSKIINFAKKNNIRIVQFPYTRSISTSAIKEKIYESLHKAKRDKFLEFNLKERVKIIPLNSLLIYENYDPIRTKKLVNRIRNSGWFFNPITVGAIGQPGKFLVIDGVNRLEAMRELGAKYISVQIVDYLNSDEVDLRSNEHYLNMASKRFFNLLAGNNIKVQEYKPSGEFAEVGERNLCLIYSKKKTYSFQNSNILKRDVETLNRLVKSYSGKTVIRRKSEVGNLIDGVKLLIRFKKFNPSDMVELALKNLRLESGITWHLVQNSVIRFKIPLDALCRGFKNKKEATKYIQKTIREKSKNLAIRRYLSNVYICDEWE